MNKSYLLPLLSICLIFSIAPVVIFETRAQFFQRLYSRIISRNATELEPEDYHCMLDVTTLQMKIDIDFEKLKHRYQLMDDHLKNTLNRRKKHAQFIPLGCVSSETIAIIIPIRNRTEHLHILLAHLHPILQKQLVRYQIYTINQLGDDTFNKGMLMNTGFNFAKEDGEMAGHAYSCFIFHDVDLLAESELNLYRCGRYNRITRKTAVFHMGHTIQKYEYKPMCCGITVGGIVAFTEEQYIAVNGYSNEFWGWGGEDDDMYIRISSRNFPIERVFNGRSTRFTMITHEKDALNPRNRNAKKLLKTVVNRLELDGLSNLQTNVTSVEYHPLYVNVTVDVGKRR